MDQWLSNRGLANSRTHAATLIEQGQVQVFQNQTSNWHTVTKPSQKISEETPTDWVRVLEGPGNRYVSRGGLKLEGALAHIHLPVQGLRVLDVGVSTGGFSDCCLQGGASNVVGIDVGHGQLAEALNKQKNFSHVEGINAKNLPDYRASIPALQTPFDLIVGDLSFISITAILPHLTAFLGPQGCILFLVKPQFELDSRALNKNGVVKDPRSYDIVKAKILECCERSGLKVDDYFSSSIEGKDGNKEFFLFAKTR
ncbi:MAG: hypothetical protein RJB66_1718 [Pseudomonadota bacterium]|jgi:23S rRNA (cytidine1920-2'-O)/16S rRNA (cytidine1409-2'-O)-methyltransferase